MTELVKIKPLSRFGSIFRNRQLIAIFLAGLFLRLSLVVLIRDYEPDSLVRFSIAAQLAKNPLAIYVNGVFLPFFQYLVSILILLGGNLTSVRLMSVAFGSLTIIPVYQMSVQISKARRIANICATLIALNPILIVYSSFAMSESLYVLLATLVAYFFITKRYTWAIAPLTLAVLTRYESWVLLPVILLFFTLKDKRFSSQKQIPVLVSSIAIVGWLWINKQYFNDPLIFLHNLGAINLPYNFDVPTIWGVPESLRGVFGFALYPLIYPFIYLPIISPLLYWKAISLGKNNISASFMLSILVVYDAFLTVTQVLHASWGWGRHFLPLIPFYVTLASACIPSSLNNKKLLAILTANILISAFFVYLQVSTESAFLSPELYLICMHM